MATSKSQRQIGTIAHNSLENAEKTTNQQWQTDWLSNEAQKIIEKVFFVWS